MPGRKRKPTHLHIVQGTAQPCRLNKLEPKAPNTPPQPATPLEPRVSFWYGVVCGRIQGLGIASSVDSEMVMLLAMRLAEVDECTAHIKEHGSVTKKIEMIDVPVPDRPGEFITEAQILLKPNPAVAQRTQAVRHAQSLLAEFGLSPASRAKVSKLDSTRKAPENIWESLK